MAREARLEVVCPRRPQALAPYRNNFQWVLVAIFSVIPLGGIAIYLAGAHHNVTLGWMAAFITVLALSASFMLIPDSNREHYIFMLEKYADDMEAGTKIKPPTH